MFNLRMLPAVLVFLCAVVTTNAQVIPRQSQIIAGEYFIGSDPGVGKGTPISISSPSTTIVGTVLNLHLAANQTVFFRFKNANGIWTAPRAITFTGVGVNRSAFVNYVEYFVGSDPGKGNGTPVSVSSAQNVPLNLSSVNLSQGQYVHLRVRDDQGRWNSPVALKYPSRSIAAAEVVVGNNPNAVVPGHGIAMTPVTGGFGTGTVNVQANVSNWNRTDTIWVRAKSSEYLWSRPVGSIALANPIPTVASISPTAATRLQTLNIQINGSNFLSGVTTVSIGSGIIVNYTSVSSGTQLTANITISATAALGTYSVFVINPSPGGGTDTLQNALTVTNPSPVVTVVQPSTVYRLQAINDTLTGGNFISGVTTVSVVSDITVSSLTIVSSSKLALKLTIPGNATLGPRNVIVTNPAPGGGTDTLKNSLVVNNPQPVLTTISPSSAFRGHTVDVQLTGNNYLTGVSSVNVGQGIFVDTSYVVGQNQINIKISIPDSIKPGNRLISVTNASPGGGNSNSANFMVADDPPTPARLSFPVNSDTLQLYNPPQPIVFSWLTSVDSDSGDSVRYSVHIVGPGLDTIFTGLQDTSLTTGLMPILKVSSIYGWSVSSTDGYTVVASPDSFLFRTSDEVTAVRHQGRLPISFALYQNYPNPFNPTTTIMYDLPKKSHVVIAIYDVLGRDVRTLVNEDKPAGSYRLTFDAAALPSGVYLCRLAAGHFTFVEKIVLIK